MSTPLEHSARLFCKDCGEFAHLFGTPEQLAEQKAVEKAVHALRH